MVTDEEVESSSWACALEVADDYMPMALLKERFADALPLILSLGGVHGSVCYDPQTAKLPVLASRRRKAAV